MKDKEALRQGLKANPKLKDIFKCKDGHPTLPQFLARKEKCNRVFLLYQ